MKGKGEEGEKGEKGEKGENGENGESIHAECCRVLVFLHTILLSFPSFFASLILHFRLLVI